ncbi:hypothetical protein [Escherichia coli]|nr:hypothetical protein [Escherichia coli]
MSSTIRSHHEEVAVTVDDDVMVTTGGGPVGHPLDWSIILLIIY